ncbi:hypothetical protein OQA88_5941 [Cercophora sp. LCS_1]
MNATMLLRNLFLAHSLSTLCLASHSHNANHPHPPRQRGLVCRSDTFDGILPTASITIAHVPSNTSYGESRLQNPAYPTPPTNLPELCALTVTIATSPTSSARFGLFLPTKWNNRLLTVGNGGFAGGINWLDMGAGVQYGFAVMSTDTGHNSTSGDVSWALNQPERQTDFGWRAMHMSIEAAEELLFAYYSTPATKSYYSGCSTGGRQGLKEIQMFPDSFDGALIGAPAWWSTNLATWTTWVRTVNEPDGGKNMSVRDMAVWAREVMRQCDGVDGVWDGIIAAPERCVLDFEQILCGTEGVDAEGCLTREQIDTAKRVYGDYLVDGAFMFPGLSVGSEDLWSVLLGQAAPDPRGQEYVKMFVLGDSNWDWKRYNDTIAKVAAAMDPGDLTADAFDISKFRDRGGKIIMYHGDSDGMIPAKSSDYYYNQTATAMGGVSSLQSWFRYFHVPGLGHCSGTRVNAPWYFAGGNQAGSLGTGTYSVPGSSGVRHDALLALVDWVEKDREVDSIIATTWKAPSDPASGVLRQRPLYETFDYIIVGGGTAGLVVASRLTENADVRVLVIEAGADRSNDPLVLTPGLVAGVYGNENSALNFLMLLYPTRGIIDAWASLGNKGWDFDSLAPYFRKFATVHAPSKAARDVVGLTYHDDSIVGGDGPIHVSFSDGYGATNKARVDSFSNEGLEVKTDPRTGTALGAFRNPASIDPATKTRSFAATGYYSAEVAKSPNLVDGVPVAIGVEVITKDGKIATFSVSLEVILTAGALQTPQLLELSGVGGRDILKGHGIGVVVDDPAVGENLQDHPIVCQSFEVGESTACADTLRDPNVLQALIGMYQDGGSGPLGQSNISVAYTPLVCASGPLSTSSAEELLASVGSVNGREVLRKLLVSGEAAHQHLLLPSRVTISRNPTSVAGDVNAPPIWDPKYNTNPVDLEILSNAVQFVERLVAPTSPLGGLLKTNGKRVQDIVAQDTGAAKEIVRQAQISVFHVAGSCAMLPQEKGRVVDDRLRGLRIVDAGIFPLEPSGNIQSVVYAIAERAADLIKEDRVGQ